MKIVQINCSAFGSTGNIARDIHRRLLDNGDESYFFYGMGNCEEKKTFLIGSPNDLHLHSFLSRNTGKQGYFSHIPTKKLISKLKKINPDIIHLHNIHGSYLNLPMLFSYLKDCGAKIVITLHDCWLFTGKCPHFTVVGCDRWLEKCGSCPQLSIYPKSRVDRTEKNLADKKKWLSGLKSLNIVTVSDWLKNTAQKSFLNEYPIRRIYNGIDTGVFYPHGAEKVRQKYGLEGKFVVLGVSSSWNIRKGLASFAELAGRLSENDAVVLVGLTAEQQAGLPSNVIGIERTENKDELAMLYSAADVFINFSLEETFGLVTAEAMACGTPAIVYNSTGCAEVVSESTGVIVKPNDLDEIKKCIDRIKSGEASFGESGVRHIRENYSKERMVQDYIDLYCQINNPNT